MQSLQLAEGCVYISKRGTYAVAVRDITYTINRVKYDIIGLNSSRLYMEEEHRCSTSEFCSEYRPIRDEQEFDLINKKLIKLKEDDYNFGAFYKYYKNMVDR